MAADTDDAALADRLARIKKLTDDLARTQADSMEARQLAERIKREVDATREALKIPKP
jgi:phage shock protein A